MLSSFITTTLTSLKARSTSLSGSVLLGPEIMSTRGQNYSSDADDFMMLLKEFSSFNQLRNIPQS